MIWLIIATVAVAVIVGSAVVLRSGSDEELERDERDISGGRQAGASR
jgi:hypothetical protein